MLKVHNYSVNFADSRYKTKDKKLTDKHDKVFCECVIEVNGVIVAVEAVI